MDNILAKLFEHNNWSNQKIIQACTQLTEAQLDAQPHSATRGTIRDTVTHLVRSQYGYWQQLTLPPGSRSKIQPALDELEQYVLQSGDGLLSLARGEHSAPLNTPVITNDGWRIEPWVLLLQAINHATEHREQIKSMLTALGLTPPDIDGWDYALFANAMQRSETQ